ncbi:MAG: DNA repair protein RecN [Paludibacteraceae bacterium]|nr:DNA repair protein RecN [Paludibacteraceae bacterium]
MLQHLHIQNYALIANLDIDFTSGFSVLTGETGAGKSIILGALALVLGGKADAKSITDGEERCVIEADFGEYLIRRELHRNGRSRSFVNDEVVSQAELKTLASQLIDIHSQHENLLIGSDSFQLSVVDSLADNARQRQEYTQIFDAYTDTFNKIKELKDVAEKTKKDADYIRFQWQQLNDIRLSAGEEEELEDEIYKLSHAEEIRAQLIAAGQLLNGDENSVLTLLHNCHLDGADNELEERLRSAEIELTDIAREADRMAERTESDPTRLQEAEERMDALNSLMHKHHCSNTGELIELRQRFEEQLLHIDSFDDEIAGLERQLADQKRELTDKADRLTLSRANVKQDICRRLTDNLSQLGIRHAHVDISMDKLADFTPDGQDDVQFMFAANLNQSLRRVSEVASGGEISRLMLCIKSLIAQTNGLPTIIFDEIDTGVSGEIATQMGVIMRKMADSCQIIAITHLAQIAALGQEQYKVYKQDTANRTETAIIHLTTEQRIHEIATMLSGNTPTDAALTNARQLLAK